MSGNSTTSQGDVVTNINYSLYNDVSVRMDTAIVEGNLDVNATMGFKNSTSWAEWSIFIKYDAS